METDKRIDVNTRPYFIKQLESGIFALVSGICPQEDGSVNFDFTDGRLRAGLDIKEIPNRNIRICVSYRKADNFGIYLINELKRLGEISGCDYVSYECFGEAYSEKSFTDGLNVFSLVHPRLFRKIVDC